MKNISLIMTISALLLYGCGGSGGGSVETNAPETPAVAASNAVTYAIDTEESIITWMGKKLAYNHEGTIKLNGGSISTDGGMIQAGNFTVDMNSMMENGKGTFDSEEKVDKLIGHLKSPDFFEVETYPTSTFEITEASKDNIKGNLTIKGVTKEINFPIMYEELDGRFKAKASFVINRADWNIQYGSGTFFDNLGDEVISDDIAFTVTVIGNS